MTGNYPSIHIGMSQKIKSYLCRRRATKVIKFAKFTMTNCNALSYVSRLLKENRGPQHILCCVKSGGVRRLILQLPEFTVNFFFFFFFFFFCGVFEADPRMQCSAMPNGHRTQKG